MSTLTGVDLSSPPDGLGVLVFRGPDAARFLQGQLSADVEKLEAGASTLAGLHNPQGRAIALLALLRTSTDEVLAVLPRELAAGVEQKLRKYILRSKVQIEDLSEKLLVIGSASGPPPASGIVQLPWADRRLLIAPATHAVEDPQPRADWERADIAAGLPQVYTATSEAFVAQMLNLDLLGAIAFDKGCYTGQEVIARAHYRGRVKRRLQRWHVADGAAPVAGASVRSADGRTLTVVRSAPGAAGGWDLLAVGTFAAGGEDAPGADPGAPPGPVTGPLALPYPLPEQAPN